MQNLCHLFRKLLFPIKPLRNFPNLSGSIVPNVQMLLLCQNNILVKSGSFPFLVTPQSTKYYAKFLVKHPQSVISPESPVMSSCITLHIYQQLKLVFWDILLFKLFIFHFEQPVFICSQLIFQFITEPSVKRLSLLSHLFTGHAIYSLRRKFFFPLVFVVLLLFWLCSKLALTFVRG